MISMSVTKPKYTGVTPFGSGWQYRLKIKLENGRVVDTRIRTDSNGNPFLTAKAAHEARKAHEVRLRTQPTEPVSEPLRASLSDVYSDYLESAARDRAAATLRKQDSMWRNHICPLFGDSKVDDISINDLQNFLFDLYQTHAYRYVEAHLKFFYLLFGHAYKMEVIDPDRYVRMFVTRSTRLAMPKMTQADHVSEEEGAEVYSDDDLYSITKIFQSEDGNLLLAYYLGLYCGLRISETFGLRWSCVNWDDRTITIDRQLQYVNNEWHLSPVKTLTSVRKVLVPDALYEELEFNYSLYIHQLKSLGNAYRNTERVYDEVTKEWIVGCDFVNRKKNGELLTVNSMKYWAKKIKSELGIDFKYHSLRHTMATHAAAANVPMVALMSLLGHKKLETTKKYYFNAEDKYVRDVTKRLLEGMYTKLNRDDYFGIRIEDANGDS
jgi:integrase